ncbi:hypothetical protein CYG48_05920 [Neorhizobium sp. SOG26]|nr:hypothetical protein CYG48_05920 [Neorhizobium sp. SOG26]
MQRYSQELAADALDANDLREEIARLLSLISELESRSDLLSLDDVDALRDGIETLKAFSRGRSFEKRVTHLGFRRVARAALIEDCDFLRNLTTGMIIGLNVLRPDELASLIPEQKVAAYKFAYEHNKIVVVDQPSEASGLDAATAEAAREVLVEQGERILLDLQGSNCSPRLVQAYQALQDKLAQNKNLVQVGILNSACSRLTLASEEELSTSLFEMLKAHIDSVYNYLAQDPQWRAFVEHSMSTYMERQDVDELIATARAIADQLARSETAAVEAVPVALNTVADLAEGVEKPDGRLTLALARTIENLISLVARGASTLKSDVASEARKWAARVVLGAVAAAAIATIAKVPGAEWIPDTVAYVLRSVLPK